MRAVYGDELAVNIDKSGEYLGVVVPLCMCLRGIAILRGRSLRCYAETRENKGREKETSNYQALKRLALIEEGGRGG